MKYTLSVVMPAKAGIQNQKHWVPAPRLHGDRHAGTTRAFLLRVFAPSREKVSIVTRIEWGHGFWESACLPSGPHRQAQLSADWVREVGEQALILEALKSMSVDRNTWRTP